VTAVLLGISVAVQCRTASSRTTQYRTAGRVINIIAGVRGVIVSNNMVVQS
jgi:hypothetical protein